MTGSRAMDAVAAAADGDERAAGDLGEGGAGGVRADGVLVAVDHEHRAAHSLADGAEALEAADVQAQVAVDQRRRLDLQSPPDAVLDLLGRVRFGEHPAEEVLEEVGVVVAPVVAVVLGPALGLVDRLVERVDAAFGEARDERHRWTDGDESEDAVGVVGGQLDAPQRAARQRDEDRPVGGCGVEHGERVGGELVVGVGGGPAGRSDRPLPRPSNVTTRWCRAR